MVRSQIHKLFSDIWLDAWLYDRYERPVSSQAVHTAKELNHLIQANKDIARDYFKQEWKYLPNIVDIMLNWDTDITKIPTKSQGLIDFLERQKHPKPKSSPLFQSTVKPTKSVKRSLF